MRECREERPIRSKKLLNVGGNSEPEVSLQSIGIWFALVLFACLLVTSLSAVAQQRAGGCGSPRPLSRTLHHLEIRHVTLLSALLRLGYDHGICFGIEISDSSMRVPVPKLIVEEISLGATVRKLLATAQGYEATESGSIVLIRKTRHPPSWLDTIVPEFKLQRASVQDASNLLYMELRLLENPSMKGIAGDYPPGSFQLKIGPIAEYHKTARELLNVIVGHSPGGMWIAGTSMGPSGSLWRILEYSEPREQNAAILGSLVRQFEPQQ